MTHIIYAGAKDKAKTLVPYWSRCVGAGRAHEGLRANWLEQLERAVKECGFEYIRFHGLLHDEMFICKKRDGIMVFNWQYVDELFDRLLHIGIRPFVEFGFMPKELASAKDTQFWWKGNVTPPADYNEWNLLIRSITQHWIDRYGLEEVRNWYFEVWNEPNLSAFWKGTKSEYFRLYKETVITLKALDAGLRVGGPATSNFVPDERFEGDKEDPSRHRTFQDSNIDHAEWRPVWVRDFLVYCQTEGLPVDFVSTHPYPTDFALDGYGKTRGFSRSVDSTRNDLKLLKEIVAASAYPTAEIHLTEWSSSPSPRDHSHDHLPAAAFVVKTNLDASGLADSLSYWVFTDVFEESGAGDSIFHGGFGMINFQGIAKPTYHAYRFLNALGEEELSRSEVGIVTRHAVNGRITALLYRYDEEVTPTAVPLTDSLKDALEIQQKGTSLAVTLEIRDLPPYAVFDQEIVDSNHGYAVPLWEEQGTPEPPTREQLQSLRARANNTSSGECQADAQGTLKLQLELPSWGIVLVNQQGRE